MSNVFRSQYHPSYHHRPRRMSAALLVEATKPFHRKLLKEAKKSLRSNQDEMAVVLSQAASEMCTEWALTTLLNLRDDQDLAEPILELFQTSDICNDKLRPIYIALSKDNVQKAPFWQKLKNHHSRRNKIVHKGAKCSHNEAQESVDIVGQFIQHIEEIVSQLQNEPEKKKEKP